jgi:uroporphyrin-III C-methyltransferase/precorrin-2 dehydrogenase/sirohydrochlorin ferrochelatase
LRQLQLLGSADAILHEPSIPAAILDRARADASRYPLPHDGPLPAGLVLILRRG